MALTHVLLGLLDRGERYGYQMRCELEDELGPEWRLDFGQLYRLLRKMERDGWISARNERRGRGPVQKTYTITRKGRGALQTWLRLATEPTRTRGRDELPAKLRFAPDQLIAIGSDDLVLASLSQYLQEKHPGTRFVTESVGSLAGLLALRDGRAHLAGMHLLDIESGEYNVSFVRHLLPEEPMLLVNLARREQGLMIAPRNPKNIRRLSDLTRADVRMINRQAGAGTRLLLFHQLRRSRIDPHAIAGYERAATTHAAVAAAIKAGTADVGPGIRACACACGLDFIPLGEERYDLAIPRRLYESAQLRPLLETLQASDFRRAAASLDGYDVSDMSRVVADVH